MNTTTFSLSIELITELLGSQPTKDVTTKYLAKRSGVAIPDDEIETLPDALEQFTTVFHHLADGAPCLYDYQVKGMLKESAEVLNGIHGVKALRSKVESTVFISPRRIRLSLPSGQDIDYLERPLRAQTARGPRVALARSEMLPTGTTLRCGVEIIDSKGITETILRELLDYGYYHGLGQWRTGGCGRFRYELAVEE